MRRVSQHSVPVLQREVEVKFQLVRDASLIWLLWSESTLTHPDVQS